MAVVGRRRALRPQMTGTEASMPAITNALTIDVEDYFQVSAMAPYIRRGDWD